MSRIIALCVVVASAVAFVTGCDDEPLPPPGPGGVYPRVIARSMETTFIDNWVQNPACSPLTPCDEPLINRPQLVNTFWYWRRDCPGCQVRKQGANASDWQLSTVPIVSNPGLEPWPDGGP
jgi:hypothetical protein